jgi:NitT/TauT family transport system substrate-binding protein
MEQIVTVAAAAATRERICPMNSKILRGVAAALAIGGALAISSSAVNAQQPFRLIITETETPLVPNSVMILAQELGYYDAEGVNVELVRVSDTTNAVAALQAGEGEMANVALDAAMQVVANNVLDVRAVTTPDKFIPFLIACQDDVADIADMAGRTYGVNRVGSLDYGLARMVMTANGLDPETLDYVPIGFTSARAEALAAGQIECTTMSIGVWLSIPDRTGLKILVPVADFGAAAPVVNKTNLVTTDTLAARGDEVEAVVRALIKLSRDFNENPQMWVDAMLVSRPDQSEDVLSQLANSFVGTWSVNGGLVHSQLEFSVEQIFAGDDFAGLTAPTLDQWVDWGPICSVLADLGTDPNYDGGDEMGDTCSMQGM